MVGLAIDKAINGAQESISNAWHEATRSPRKDNLFADVLLAGILAAQYLCGLAALTSASRMTFAFARDGGLPASRWLRAVNPRTQSPSVAVWTEGS